MATSFEYDVFLSHNSRDKPRVRRLAEQLRRANLRIWFDEWQIKPGDDIYLAIERGLETSRTLVLCLTQAALDSDWVGLERSTVLFRDPRNVQRRFIPLLLADCKVPDTIRRFRHVDLREESESAVRELLRACGIVEASTSSKFSNPEELKGENQTRYRHDLAELEARYKAADNRASELGLVLTDLGEHLKKSRSQEWVTLCNEAVRQSNIGTEVQRSLLENMGQFFISVIQGRQSRCAARRESAEAN